MSAHFLLRDIHKVNVFGFTIQVVPDEHDQPMIPIHGLVEAIGVNYGDEYQRLKNDRRFGAKNLRVSDGKGGQYDEVVVPLTKLHAFLFSMNPDALNPEARARLELFQSECVDVLNDYWNKGLAINVRLERGNTESTKYRDARKLSRPQLVEAVKRLCDYGRAGGVTMDEDDTYHHLICFCWDRLGRGPMKAENEPVDTKVFGVDSYLLAAMERSAVRLIDHVIAEEQPVEHVLQYLDEGIENELSKIADRAFEVLEKV